MTRVRVEVVPRCGGWSADWQSAIRQVSNLRYESAAHWLARQWPRRSEMRLASGATSR